MTPPRESRLRKAALTLLVAATAAVFVGAPVSAVAQVQPPLPQEPIPQEPIPQQPITLFRITSIGPYHSGYDTFEGDSHSMRADTNVNFDTVDWYVNDSFVRTDNGPSTTSVFNHDYADLGSTTGAPVVVKAVAADANGSAYTARKTINVWTKSETVNIVSKTSDQALVGATTENVSVQTDVGFYRVDWSIDDGIGRGATVIPDLVNAAIGTTLSTNGPGLTSQITYDFSTVPHGRTVTFTATPYGVNADGEAVAGEAASIEIVAWNMISIDSVSPFKLKVVKGEELDMYVRTNIPFSRIEYSVEFGGTHIVNSERENSTGKVIPLRFNNVGPNNDPLEGNELDIVVTAYATINGEEFKSDPVTETVTVYAGNGHTWKTVRVYIDSFVYFVGDIHSQTTSHIVKYYNDDANPGRVSFFRRNGWWVGDRPDHFFMDLFDGRTVHGWVLPELGYSKTLRDTITSDFSMRLDKFHGGHAVTGFDGPDEGVIEFNTVTTERYMGPGSGLPPTGTASDRNWHSQKGIKLAD